MEPCPRCEGSGTVRMACRCGGSGYTIAGRCGGHYDGTRTFPCIECDGMGFKPAPLSHVQPDTQTRLPL